ncbi:MAG TPA: histidine kinase dimerization/phospho-acceptor domain-containing protein, partial [Opitutales bacterium]|nr:histidine kinase dimerization/phospho-acceptor domain-containing protein [Opitutales bacterium]
MNVYGLPANVFIIVILTLFAAIAAGTKTIAEAIPVQRRDGSIFPADIASAMLKLDGRPCLVGIFRDISKRLALENELRQAQKMEAVGRLAGGVAHDFNNMLMAILGYVDLALDHLEPDHPARADLEEVTRSAHRSADLTRQLLAFARKQTIAPKRLDLTDTVASMLKLLRCLLGEDIELVWTPGPASTPIMIDPAQIDQVLANLCVNARDAINGIVKQNGGFINVHSEVGHGTTFKIFLPL